jgi:hypothetical protein
MKQIKNINVPKWKQVEIKGSLISGTDDFDGFAGMEVLENYDASFLLGSKKNKVNFQALLN